MSDRPPTTRFRLRQGERVHPLPPGTWVAGRGEGCDVVVDDRSASRRHARFVVGDAVEVEDLGSVNGVLVNNVAITKRTTLGHGDRVGIASAVLVLVDAEQRGGSATRPGRTLASPVPGAPGSLTGLEAAIVGGDLLTAQHLAAVVVEQATARPLETHEVARLEKAILALGGDDPSWLERILELRARHGSVPDAAVVTRLFELARAGRPPREAAIRAYLAAMKGRIESLPTAARFVYRRLEGLLRAKADV